jgi:hypothetical protein
MSRPIIVYAYNRPDYLDQVLEALKPQTKDSEVFLFQDGPRILTDDKPKVAESVSVFKKHFPKSTVFDSPVNLGVGFNQKRAREFIFSRADSAIFVEDDIVLNSYYIEQLNFLMDKFQDDEDIGMISCFGEIHRHTDVFGYCDYLTKYDDWDKQQERNKDKFMQMEHIWGYGFFKRAYERVVPFMEGYYAMLPDDYRGRPHKQILQYCDQYGISPSKVVTSQDSVLSAFLALHNMIKISTFTMNAKYIGEWGEHSNADHYAQNWKNYKPYNKPVKDFLWDDKIKEKIRTLCKIKFLK